MNLPNAIGPTCLYNDSQGTVDWSKTTSTKGMRHINLKDCAVRDSIQAKEMDICHIPGDINPSDIFTKEPKKCATVLTSAHFATPSWCQPRSSVHL